MPWASVRIPWEAKSVLRGGRVSDRLSPRDVAFLSEETLDAPRHNATIDILDAGEGFDYDEFLALVSDRLAFVPRYRQRVQAVPGRLANPVWVDDERFDLGYHVRRSALPRPGSDAQLRELVSRIVSRPLDRSRPLWEMYVVEGLADGRIAVLTKTHQALVDGIDTIDLGQILLDVNPTVQPTGEEGDGWSPRSPSNTALVIDAVRDMLTDVETISGTARGARSWLAARASGLLQTVTTVAEAVAGQRSERETPLTGRLSQQRLVVTLTTDLADYRAIREGHGGTINDVILAVVAGGLRTWLMTRAEKLAGLRSLPVVVPVSVIDDDLEATLLGSQIAPHHVELPIGEPSPVVRLHQVSYAFDVHKSTGRAVAAGRLAGITGFAPATFHAMGSRVAAAEADTGYVLSVTNVPGPQSPRYAAGSRLIASYPVHPLIPGHALAIGVTSYDGKVFYGLTADRDLLPDASVIGHCLLEALEELRDTVNGQRHRVPRGRTRKDDS
jgi:diacylglycerol O-acyltransferase